jgi:hypothetical protein
MNTLGKILVILNFVFALVVGAFITMKSATETNWKAGVEQLQQELVAARASSTALQSMASGLQNQITAVKTELEAKKLELSLKQAEWAVQEAKLQKDYKDAEARGKLAEITLESGTKAMERMQKEVEDLKSHVEKRDGLLVDVHKKYRDAQDLINELDRSLKFSQDRNDGLLKRVQEMERDRAEAVTGVKSTDAVGLAKDPNAPNPPAKFIKGIVEKVDAKDTSLASLSLGTDHGLKVGNTLEVYRLSPSVEYIGLIRIEDAHHHSSIGKLIRTPGNPLRAMREGDVVSSSINAR